MKVKHQILKDSKDNDFINEQGYFVIEVLSATEIESFISLYKKWHPQDPEEFYKSYFSPNQEYKREVEKKVKQAFHKVVSEKFVNCEAFGGMFVVKPQGEKGHFPPHQDWSFVDETEFWSLNMWSPLEQVDESNGYLYVLPGSHRFNETIRGANTPDTYDQLTEDILPAVKGIPMKAGEAIFFFHGLVHGSTINAQDEARVSVGLSLVQKDAPLLYHFYDEEQKKTERYQVKDLSFYIDYVSNRDKKPESIESIESLGIVDFEYFRLDKEAFFQKLGKETPKIKVDQPNMFRKLMAKLGI